MSILLSDGRRVLSLQDPDRLALYERDGRLLARETVAGTTRTNLERFDPDRIVLLVGEGELYAEYWTRELIFGPLDESGGDLVRVSLEP